MAELSDGERALALMLASLVHDLDRRGILDSRVYAKTFAAAAERPTGGESIAYRHVSWLLSELKNPPKPGLKIVK